MSLPAADNYELSPMQSAMLFHAVHTPGHTTNFNQLGCRLVGELQPAAFRRAWQGLVDRHPVLRTSFHWQGLERPLQAVHPALELPWTEEDWRGLDPAEQRARWSSYLASDLAAGFALDRAPLMRCRLARVAEDAYLFGWSHHHIISDGWCLSLVMEEIFHLYGHLARGLPLALPPAQPYRRYIEWLQRQDGAAAGDFWKRYLAGFRAPTPMPARRQGDNRFGAATERLQLELSEPLSRQLRGFAARHQLTLNTLIQGAWALLLARYSGDSEVVFGTTVSGRPTDLPGAGAILGLFINAVPLRAQVDPRQPLALWLKMLQARAAARSRFEHTPLTAIQRCSELPASAPLFESNVIFMNYPLDESLAQGAHGLLVEDVQLYDRADVPVELRATAKACWLLELSFDPQRFESPAMQRMLGHVAALLEQFAADAARPLGRIPLLGERERKQILEAFNDTAVAFDPALTTIHRFEQAAARAPERIAVECAQVRLSAGELNARANRLARRLLAAAELGRDDIVALCAHRSERMMEAILAIWKCGAAYLPIDPDYPVERIRTILDDSRAKLVVSAAGLFDPGLAADFPAVMLEEPDETTDGSNLGRPVAADALAYVIYTSGSTGKPKGAMIEHAGMLNHMLAEVDEFAIGPETALAQSASHCFDISVWQFFTAPLMGGRTVIFGNELLRDPPAFLDRLESSRTNLLEVVPSFLTVLMESAAARPAALRHLRCILVTGEMVSPALLEAWFAAYPGIPVVNAYGPAEASDDVAQHRMEAAPPTPYVPVGRPIRNMRIYIADAQLNLCPVGVPGEICVAGIGVGRGYLNDPEGSRSVFHDDPFHPGRAERLYRTGDTGVFLEDGSILFHGRKDHQVKIRGHRIELGEIDNALARLPAVRQAAALDCRDEAGHAYLCAYLAFRVGEAMTDAELAGALSAVLPEYMVPGVYVVMDALPLNPNGKIDRKALPPPAAARRREAQVHTPPRNATEALLARVWGEALGIPPPGVHDNLFALGGDSILSMRIVALAARAGLKLTTRQILQHPTVAELATEATASAPEASIPALPEQAWYAVSRAQRRIWLADRSAAPGTYAMSGLLQIDGDLDADRLAQVLERLVDRHESLRTVFAMVEGELRQRVLSREELGFRVERPAARSVREMEALMREQAHTPFDLAVGPPFRAALARLSPTRHVLLLCMHHAVSDAWSTRVLSEEMQALYAGRELPAPSIHYRDYAHWHNALLEGPRAEAGRAYWHAKLAAPVPRLELPTDHPRPERSTHEGEAQDFELLGWQVERLAALGRRCGASLYATMLASVYVLLHRYSGSRDLVIGGTSAGRDHEQLHAQVGVFVNALALRLQLDPADSVETLIGKAAATAAEALEHGAYPFDLLLEELKLRTPPNRFPLFDVHMDYVAASVAPPDGLKVTDLTPASLTSKFDLSFYFVEADGRLLIRLIYNTRLFAAATIATMLERLLDIQEAFLRDPLACIGGISLAAAAPPPTAARKVRVGLRLKATAGEENR